MPVVVNRPSFSMLRSSTQLEWKLAKAECSVVPPRGSIKITASCTSIKAEALYMVRLRSNLRLGLSHLCRKKSSATGTNSSKMGIIHSQIASMMALKKLVNTSSPMPAWETDIKDWKEWKYTICTPNSTAGAMQNT